jgi:hypothetical protein
MLKCSVEISQLLQGRHVHLSFVTFELEEEQDCGYDFIEVSSSTVWVANGHAGRRGHSRYV